MENVKITANALQVYNSKTLEGIHMCEPNPDIPWSCARVVHLG
jgi:hypothetical protein